MREFWHFLRHFLRLLYFIRGVLAALIINVVLAAILLMEVEGLTFGDALYATAITALTVGYGDITPKTTMGKFIVVVIGFVGVVFTGLIVAVATRALAHAVDDERRTRSAKQRQQNAAPPDKDELARSTSDTE